MIKFTKTVNKEIENIFEEFEDLFITCIKAAEFNDIITEFDEGTTTLERWKNYNLLEREFDIVIESIKVQLIKQFNKVGPFELISFTEMQNLYFVEWLSETRKKRLYNVYLYVIVGEGDRTVFDNFKPTKDHAEFINYIFSAYEIYYNKLKNECDILFDKYLELANHKKPEVNNWIDLIEPLMLPLIENAEKKANHKSSAIRCAAFCELLFEKKYIKPTNTRVKTLTTFAASRYGLNISNALKKSKEDDRNEHKNFSKSGFEPLKKCF